MLEPSTDNVSQVIIEEMMKWNRHANEATRRDELTALSARLIRYFAVFHAQPTQLDGLPGGHGVNPADAALGRRKASRAGLMGSSTGLIVGG